MKVILLIVLTLNQFGSLAINTSMLLEKEEGQPYPWICNLHDFENIIEILNYLEKNHQDFINYITWRIDNHEKILSSDELDVIEEYFLNPELIRNTKNNILFFEPSGPSLIDKIYFEKKGISYNHPAINSNPTKKKK